MKLDLGCGDYIKEGWIGVDRYDYGNNIIWDIQENGLSIFPDNSCSALTAIAFMEHISQERVIYVMNECHRVLKENGYFDILVAKADSAGAHSDPTHCSVWTHDTFDRYFSGAEIVSKYYGILPWNIIKLNELKRNIECKLSPKKNG